MNQSTTFAQVATNQFDYLSSALCANTPPCKKHSSSRKFLTLSISLRLLLVMLLTLTVSANVWGAEKTYTHIFTTKPDIGNNSLSNITWSVEATNLNGYNKGYAGVQFGTKNASGSITLTSANAWGEQSNTSYTGYTNVKFVYVWLNAGTGTPTATVTIGGKEASKSGTVSKNTAANDDYESTSKLTFTPISGGNTGVIKIAASTSSKAGYIAAIEVVCETPAASCTTPPTVSSATNSNITSTTATVSCSSGITSLGSAGCSIESYGFVYGTSSNPTISNTKVQVGTTYATTGTAFSKELTGLTANTTYYVRPYATNGNGTAYGAQTSFTTLELPKYTITWNVISEQVGTTTIVEGQEWTLPEVNASCNDKQFVGWTTTPILEEQDEAPSILYTETIQFPLETNTYYAVFANVEVTGTGEYVKVTKDLADYSGEYLIVYEEGSRAFNGGLEESLLDGNDNYISITISDNVVQATDEVENARFIVAKVDGGYSIQSASGLYIGRAANSNGTDIEQTYNVNLVNTFPNCSTIRGKGGADIQYNNNTYPSQQNRFRYYASSLNTIALYKKTGTNMTNYTTSCVPTYTITWQNEDGTVLATDKVAENTMPEYNGSTPTKEADAQYTYTFDGWTPDIVEATEDATYTATYTKTLRDYTITWKNEDGTVLETDNNVPYGETPTYNGATPTKTATAQYTYTFNGWSPEVTSVTGDATYIATFTETLRTYTITWKNDDGTTLETDENVPYGTTPSYDGEEPTKTATAQHSYDFNGWNPTITTVTGDATYTAKYTAIVNIIWMVNGIQKKSTTASSGASVTPPDVNPIPCGAVLAGWTDAENGVYVHDTSTLYEGEKPSIVVTENKTFYAVFADYEN